MLLLMLLSFGSFSCSSTTWWWCIGNSLHISSFALFSQSMALTNASMFVCRKSSINRCSFNAHVHVCVCVRKNGALINKGYCHYFFRLYAENLTHKIHKSEIALPLINIHLAFRIGDGSLVFRALHTIFCLWSTFRMWQWQKVFGHSKWETKNSRLPCYNVCADVLFRRQKTSLVAGILMHSRVCVKPMKYTKPIWLSDRNSLFRS